MTSSRDLEHVLGRYLEDGPTELPDRSYDEVRTSIDTTKQRVVLGPWRSPSMPTFVRLAAVGVIVFVLSLAIFNINPRQGGVGNVPSSEPSPSASPSASPAVLPDQNAPTYSPKPLAAGDYAITDPAVTNAQRLTYTVPEGWSTSQAYLVKHPGEPGYVMLTPYVVSHVYADGCHWNNSAIVSAGTSVDELVNVLSAQTGRTTTAPVDVSVAGYGGKQIVLTQPIVDVTTCTNGILRYWPDPGPDFSGGLCCDPAGNIDVIDVLDVAGHRMLLVARHYPGSSEADLAELQGIIDSIRIEPLPAPATPSAGSSASPAS
jgi:hypothetical protein